jgi:hypothetical protein
MDGDQNRTSEKNVGVESGIHILRHFFGRRARV